MVVAATAPATTIVVATTATVEAAGADSMAMIRTGALLVSTTCEVLDMSGADIVAALSPLSNFQGQLPDAAVTLDNAAVAYGSAAASPANDSDTNIETKVLPSESAFGNEGANVTSAFSSSSSSDGSANHIVIQAPTPKRPAMAPNFINMSSSAATTPSLVSASTAPAPGPATKNEAVKKETAKDNTVKKETARDNTVQKETAKDEVAKNETKATKHVFDPAFKAVDAAFDVVLDEKILSRLHELDPANAAYLKDNIEKIYAANSGRTASLNKVRDALTADLTNAYGYEQKIDEKLMFHFDRFARKFEESINAPDAESKNALLVEAAKSIQAALRWSDQARIYRKEVDKLSRDVTALDAKLFRDVESSLNNVVGSVKHVLGMLNIVLPFP
jgi:hypothetical protein